MRATHFAEVVYADTMTDGVVQSTVIAVYAWADGKYTEVSSGAARHRCPSHGICNVPETVKVGDVLPLRPWG